MIEFFKDQFKDWKLLAKYVISGSTAALVQLGILALLVEKFRLWHLHAVVYAFLISATVAFFLQKFWTFRDVSMDNAHFQMFSYLLLASVAFLMNIGLMYLFVDIMGWWYIFAQILTMGMVVVVVFLCNKYFIFNRKSVIFGKEEGV